MLGVGCEVLMRCFWGLVPPQRRDENNKGWRLAQNKTQGRSVRQESWKSICRFSAARKFSEGAELKVSCWSAVQRFCGGSVRRKESRAVVSVLSGSSAERAPTSNSSRQERDWWQLRFNTPAPLSLSLSLRFPVSAILLLTIWMQGRRRGAGGRPTKASYLIR